jgi:serine/threonine-protein kinase SRK2
VILAQDMVTHDLVAVKKLPRCMAANLQLERELLTHSSLRHPHIVRFQQVFLSPHNCNLVLEYVPGERNCPCCCTSCFGWFDALS